MNQKTPLGMPQPPVTVHPAKQELKFAGKWAMRAFFAAVVLCILIYLTHFFSGMLTLLVSVTGVIIILASLTYTLGHFIRFLAFSGNKTNKGGYLTDETFPHEHAEV